MLVFRAPTSLSEELGRFALKEHASVSAVIRKLLFQGVVRAAEGYPSTPLQGRTEWKPLRIPTIASDSACDAVSQIEGCYAFFCLPVDHPYLYLLRLVDHNLEGPAVVGHGAYRHTVQNG